jgi:hypothetical protein
VQLYMSVLHVVAVHLCERQVACDRLGRTAGIFVSVDAQSESIDERGSTVQ